MYSAATRRAPAIGPATAPFAIDAAELIALSAIASSAAMLVLLAGNALFRDDGLARLGLRLRQAVPAIPIGMAGIILIMPLITWVGMLTIKLWELLGLEHDTKHEMLRILERTDDRGLARLLIFTAAVIAPLYEEVLFRGHLQTLLAHLLARVRRGPEPAAGAAIPPPLNAPYEPPAASALPYAAPEVAPRQPIPLPSAKWMAIIMTSIAFAIVHPWWTTPPIFFLSVCLGYAYERWKNLWIPIVMHALFNALSMMVSQYVPQ
jgi:membrane protease YdiL (CAAX protease family)